MTTALMVLQAFISVLLIITVLLQFAKGAEAGLMTAAGSESIMSRSSKSIYLYSCLYDFSSNPCRYFRLCCRFSIRHSAAIFNLKRVFLPCQLKDFCFVATFFFGLIKTNSDKVLLWVF